jgi:uncharacterized membrane protein HdeD (DUF308 family)
MTGILYSGRGWLALFVVAAIFAAALGISVSLGQNATNGCLWAMLVSVVAGCGGLAPVIYLILSRSSLSVEHVIGSSAIRLLLVLAGVVIILLFTKTDVMWFALWLGLFYLVVLVAEVYVAVRIMNEHGKTRELET